jgi:hypothetical protein
MDNRKLKRFSSFVSEDFPPPIAIPTNNAGTGNIAGLPPDIPPVKTPSQRKRKSNIGRRKPPIA